MADPPRSRLPEIVRVRNTTFKEQPDQLRLKEAARLLTTTSNPVSEIASAVGYGSIPHFNRVFRDCYGQAPVAFRAAPGPPAGPVTVP